MIIQIKHENVDIARAVYRAFDFAAELGFGQHAQFMIATSVSELARNLLFHAGDGTIRLRKLLSSDRIGVEIVAEDSGPGIPDVDKALDDHYSSIGSLGLGLPGVKRLMDEFEINSVVGKGTRVAARKWMNSTPSEIV